MNRKKEENCKLIEGGIGIDRLMVVGTFQVRKFGRRVAIRPVRTVKSDG